MRTSNRKSLLQHQDQNKVIVRTTDDLGFITNNVAIKEIR